MTFVREKGKLWHVAKPPHRMWPDQIRSVCGVWFNGPHTRQKEIEQSSHKPPHNQRCSRKGCLEAW